MLFSFGDGGFVQQKAGGASFKIIFSCVGSYGMSE